MGRARAQVKIIETGTPQELGDYTRRVHWRVCGKEEYWETLMDATPGAVKQYYETRRAYADSSVTGR